jgi:hypothetical protein
MVIPGAMRQGMPEIRTEKRWMIRARWSFGMTCQGKGKRIHDGFKKTERGEDYLK